jgi:DNA-binding transcriptional ArsR family regulator
LGLNLDVVEGVNMLKFMSNTTTDSGECSRILKALGDETRLKIVQLSFKGEKSVSDIAKSLKMGQPQTSHHLSILVHQVWSEQEEKEVKSSISSILKNTL